MNQIERRAFGNVLRILSLILIGLAERGILGEYRGQRIQRLMTETYTLLDLEQDPDHVIVL